MPSSEAPKDSRHLTALPPAADTCPQGREQGFRHDASLHRGRGRLMAAAAEFVRVGIEAGEAIMVCAPQDVTTQLSREISGGTQPTFLDQGHFPSRAVAQWITFADRCRSTGQAARLLISPASGRRPSAHRRQEAFSDALINLAVQADTHLWVRCAFDGEHLDADRMGEVEACHPLLDHDGAAGGSPGYAGLAHARYLFSERLVGPPGPTRTVVISRLVELAAARTLVREETRRAKLSMEEAEAVVLAVHEAAINALDHGGGTCQLRLWRTSARLVCEVRSGHRLRDPLAGHRLAPVEDDHGRGLWLANQLCDLVE